MALYASFAIQKDYYDLQREILKCFNGFITLITINLLVFCNICSNSLFIFRFATVAKLAPDLFEPTVKNCTILQSLAPLTLLGHLHALASQTQKCQLCKGK